MMMEHHVDELQVVGVRPRERGGWVLMLSARRSQPSRREHEGRDGVDDVWVLHTVGGCTFAASKGQTATCPGRKRGAGFDHVQSLFWPSRDLYSFGDLVRPRKARSGRPCGVVRRDGDAGGRLPDRLRPLRCRKRDRGGAEPLQRRAVARKRRRRVSRARRFGRRRPAVGVSAGRPRASCARRRACPLPGPRREARGRHRGARGRRARTTRTRLPASRLIPFLSAILDARPCGRSRMCSSVLMSGVRQVCH